MRTSITTSLLLFILIFTPVTSQAAVNNAIYNSMTTNEKIAYLYGMVAQLQMLLAFQIENTNANSSSNSSNNDRNRADVDISTLSATDIEEDEAELRAQIDLDGEDEAFVWFEYGEDDDDLDERTSRIRVTDNRGDRQTVSITVDDLDDDERYYFRAVVQDEDGDRSYGSVRNFRTDEDDRNSSSNNSSGSGDFDLDVSDRVIERGDSVTVDWEVPSNDASSRNWLGLYLVGNDNRSFVKWVYLDNDDNGSERFTIDNRGEYEFRLFLNNTYTDVVTSVRVEVE